MTDVADWIGSSDFLGMILNGASYELRLGRVGSVVGESGAGKSSVPEAPRTAPVTARARLGMLRSRERAPRQAPAS